MGHADAAIPEYGTLRMGRVYRSKSEREVIEERRTRFMVRMQAIVTEETGAAGWLDDEWRRGRQCSSVMFVVFDFERDRRA